MHSRLITLVLTALLSVASFSATAQNPMADSIFQVLVQTKEESPRIDLMNEIIYKVPTLTQQQRIDYTKAMLDLAKKQSDKVLESVTTAELGYLLSFNGSKLQGTELTYAALDMGLRHGNDHALGIIYNDLSHCMQERAKAIEYQHKGLQHSVQAGDAFNEGSCLGNLSIHYIADGQRDSAMHYAQQLLELSMSRGDAVDMMTYAYWLLARIHSELYEDPELSGVYLRKAVNTKGITFPDAAIRVHMALAIHHLSMARPDSALHFAGRARELLEQANPSAVLGFYNFYKDLYRTTNSDSALKYYSLAENAKADLDALSMSHQVSLLQMKKEIDLDQQAATRSRNIQYGIIGLIVITLLVFLLAISRTSVVGAKTIKNLSLVALLLLFEFINLVLSPLLGDLSGQSPLLIMFAMVVIAGLLIPLHHRMENFITNMLVSKNNRIRLEAAKRTIEELEGASGA